MWIVRLAQAAAHHRSTPLFYFLLGGRAIVRTPIDSFPPRIPVRQRQLDAAPGCRRRSWGQDRLLSQAQHDDGGR